MEKMMKLIKNLYIYQENGIKIREKVEEIERK